MAVRGTTRVWAIVLDIDRFVRLHFLFFSCLWPLLGATTVGRDTSPAGLAAVLLVGISFHVYAFVLNDVIDFPIDRTQPLRQADPLVRGAVSRRAALAMALLQPAIAAGITSWLGGSAPEYLTLAVGFGGMAVYNLWGKRCAVPPLTDAAQGVAWGTLPLYAAYALGSTPNAMTWMVAAYALGYTLFMNGIHGGLRDLANDTAQGARTTAIFLGARPRPDGADPYVPRTVTLFASAALTVLFAINTVLLLRNEFGYGGAALAGTALVVGLLQAIAAILMPVVMKPRGAAWGMAFRLQIYLVLMCLPLVFFGAASGIVLVVLAVLKVVSLAVLDSTAAIMQWGVAAVRSALHLTSPDALGTRVAGTDQ